MIRLTKLALRRPVTIILCLITIAYFGFQSVMGMKLELTPEMEMPMLIIATVYPGASPEDVTDLVTKKEEDAITSLDSVDKVQSISRENVSIVIVQYEYGTNMDTAYINLKKATAFRAICRTMPMTRISWSWISTRWRRLRWQSAATLIRTFIHM